MAIAAMTRADGDDDKKFNERKPAALIFHSARVVVRYGHKLAPSNAPKKRREKAYDFLPSISYPRHYCNGGLPEPAHGFIASPAVAAESTRRTPVSSMQYAAVPVVKVTGPALTENPVKPDAPHAAGIPEVNCGVPLFA